MAAGMYTEAIELLEKRIHAKPTDAEAHLLLGCCHLGEGSLLSDSRAKKRFESALRLNPEYRNEVADCWMRAGFAALDSLLSKEPPSDTSSALDTIYRTIDGLRQRILRDSIEAPFDEAVKYNDNLRQEISARCLDAANTLLKAGDNENASRLLSLSSKYDPLREE